MALAREMQGDRELAASLLRQAVETPGVSDKTMAMIHRGLAMVAMDRLQLEGAVEYLSVSLRLDSSGSQADAARARLFALMHRFRLVAERDGALSPEDHARLQALVERIQGLLLPD